MVAGRTHARRLGISIVGLALSGALLGGCANSKSLDDCLRTSRALQSQVVALENDLSEANQSLAEKDRQLASIRGGASGRDQLIADMQAQIDDRDRRLREMGGLINSMDQTRLDPATDMALADLAAQHPDLLSYDSEHGMLRFNSDLTFDSGSDVVKPSAKSTLQSLASVLAGTAAQYDVEIVGHTDAQRISNPETAKRHPTNTHLSAHRAISVRGELVSLGIPSARLLVAGWGAERPLVANSASGNTPQNRRVELYLRRSTGGLNASVPEASGNIGADRTAAPNRPLDVNK
ncbi:MAG: OmpA family protein [Phycisphaerales bacterium]|nr:OmpA family protein [Phycisphaerales bacterium]